MSNFIILKHCLFSGLNKPIFNVFSIGPTPNSTSDKNQNLLLPSSKHNFRCKCIPLPSDYWKQILTTLRPQSSRHLVVQTTCFLLKCETRMLKMHESAEHGYNFAVMFWDLICLAPFPHSLSSLLSVQGREIPASLKQYTQPSPSQAHMALPGASTPHQPLVGMETFLWCKQDASPYTDMKAYACLQGCRQERRGARFSDRGKIPLVASFSGLRIVFWVKRYCYSSLLNSVPVLHLLTHSA